MPDAKRDANRIATILAVTDDSSQLPTPLVVDPVTKRLKVNAVLVGVNDVSGVIKDENGIERTVNRSFVNATSAGSTTIVAAQGSGIRIRVLQYALVTPSAVNVKFQSGTVDISSTKAFAANSGQDSGYNPHGHFQTNPNEPLNINLSTAPSAPGVGVEVTWIGC